MINRIVCRALLELLIKFNITYFRMVPVCFKAETFRLFGLGFLPNSEAKSFSRVNGTVPQTPIIYINLPKSEHFPTFSVTPCINLSIRLRRELDNLIAWTWSGLRPHAVKHFIAHTIPPGNFLPYPASPPLKRDIAHVNLNHPTTFPAERVPKVITIIPFHFHSNTCCITRNIFDFCQSS